MSNKLKEIDTKNCTHYFFNDMINTKNVNVNKPKIDGKSYRNILIYYTEYVTVKDLDYATINSANPLRLIISKINGSIEKSNRNKHLMEVKTH